MLFKLCYFILSIMKLHVSIIICWISRFHPSDMWFDICDTPNQKKFFIYDFCIFKKYFCFVFRIHLIILNAIFNMALVAELQTYRRKKRFVLVRDLYPFIKTSLSDWVKGEKIGAGSFMSIYFVIEIVRIL